MDDLTPEEQQTLRTIITEWKHFKWGIRILTWLGRIAVGLAAIYAALHAGGPR